MARHVTVAIIAATALAFALACDDGPSGIVDSQGPTSIRVEIEWQHPRPQGNDLRGMCGFADGTFYAVGEAGTIVQYDGNSFASHRTPTRQDLHGIWASSTSDIYAAGFSGTVIHFNGTSWSRIASPASVDFYAVWGSASDDVYFAGTEGRVWNLRSGTWTEYAVSPGIRFRALWGYARDEIYVAGSSAHLFRFDGTNWSRITIATNPQASVEIRDLWGPSPGSLSFVAGSAIVWFEGSAWTARNVADENVYGLWGFTLDDQVAISAGSSSHWVDGSFSSYATPTEEPLFDIWGRTTSDYHAVGRYGNIARFDGVGWQALSQGVREDIRDVSLIGDQGLAVGANGTVLRSNGLDWISENIDAGYDLSGVWMDGSGGAIAVGRYAPDGYNWRHAVLVSDGSSLVDAGAVGDADRYFDVWGSAEDDVYVVGWGGAVMHFNGAEWSEVIPDSGDTAALRCVSGTGSDNIICVGRTKGVPPLLWTHS